jgi:predicted dehydrogenase
MKTASAALALPLVLPGAGREARAHASKRRYAVVGTGLRGIRMWGRELLQRHGRALDLVALVDRNGKRAEMARGFIKTEAPAFADFERMLTEARPDLVAVCTIDAYHADYIVEALDRGLEVITEKPMVIDAPQCQRVLDAAARHPGRLTVAFNYRYAPMHQKLKEVLVGMRETLGRVTSVDFNWYLDVSHGSDYFRRWHRRKDQSGSLWVHKATHHFDLVNWWLDAEPVSVFARGTIERYGRKGAYRHTHCRTCPHKAACPFFFDVTRDERLMMVYVANEREDGYLRDGCIFREDVDAYDTMSALVTYDSGVTMAYSLNAFMPFEGHRIAFNCERGRVEVRHFDVQPWQQNGSVECHVTTSFGSREAIEVPIGEGGHWGGDPVLHDRIFAPTPGPGYLRLPDARAGALSCLTGIAARLSCEQGREIRIADLVRMS